MNPISLRSDTVQVAVGGQAVPALSFSLSGTGTDLTIVPNGFLPSNATVTVSVTAGASDRAGNALTPANATFTTGPGADFLAPAVISLNPFSGQTGVPVNVAPAARFNKPLDTRFVNSGSLLLYDNVTGTNVAGSVSFSPDGRLLTFTPAANLTASRSYQFYSNGATVTDLTGNAGGSFFASFTASAGSDTTAPTLTVSSPPTGATQVPTNANLRLVFDETIDSTLLAGIALRQGAAPRQATVDVDATRRSVTIVPALLMTPNAAHTIDVIGIRDVAGNPLPSTSVTFTTGPSVDVTAPTVSTVAPSIGSTNVPRTVQPAITFSEPMNPASGTLVGFFQLYPQNTGIAVTVAVSFSPDGRTLTVTPAAQLAASTLYILQGSAMDLAGNSVSFSASFTTAP